MHWTGQSRVGGRPARADWVGRNHTHRQSTLPCACCSAAAAGGQYIRHELSAPAAAGDDEINAGFVPVVVGELLLATSVDWFYMSSPGRDSNLKTYANGDAFM